jgi:hypothetical protein
MREIKLRLNEHMLDIGYCNTIFDNIYKVVDHLSRVIAFRVRTTRL